MSPQSSPTFFKVLIDASAPQLPLPADFVTFCLKNKIPKDPIIQCANGGYSWKLKIEKVDEFYCFTHGWNNVVKDIHLGFGDFLVFSKIDESIFSVLIFGPNGCQKDLPKTIKLQHDGVNNEVEVIDVDVDDDDDVDKDDDVDDDLDKDDDVDDDNVDNDDDVLFMPITMTTNNRSIVRLTSEFVRLSGINGGGSMQIKNLDGEEFPIELRSYKCPKTKKRYYLSAGWPDFRRNNNLLEGDKCILKFFKSEGKFHLAKIPNPRKCVKFSTTEVVKRKSGGSPPHEHVIDVDAEDEPANVIKRPRGRPPKQRGIDVDAANVIKRPRGRPPKQQRGLSPQL